MQYTENLNLKKPDGTDVVNIGDINSNMDILDVQITNKVDKVADKQLSTNDYTAAEKNKLAGIEAGANKYTNADLPNASVTAKGIVQLSDATNNNSTTLSATANAVKKAYDRANQAFQSASDGKIQIATAITGKGVDARGSDTFLILANKIEQIVTDPSDDATAVAVDLLSGKTAYSKNQKITGTMPNIGTVIITPHDTDNVPIPMGYHNGSGYVKNKASGARYEFLSSTTWTVPYTGTVDVFLVGGGGGGGTGQRDDGTSPYFTIYEGAGGGGGYVKTYTNISVVGGETISITVGDGGSGSAYSGNSGNSGGYSQFGNSNYRANGGGGGGRGYESYSESGNGGSGGSGGGGGGRYMYPSGSVSGGSGGSNGGSGSVGYKNGDGGSGGSGQGTNTREFGETGGKLYAGGGGGYGSGGSGSGGSGGGGRAGNPGVNGLGGGGGGGSEGGSGQGGSGIVIVRYR